MRPTTLVALSTILLVLAATQAEARGIRLGRLFGGARAPATASRPVATAGTPVIIPLGGFARQAAPAAGAAALATAATAAASPAPVSDPTMAVAEAVPPRPKAAWCPSNRAQTGFCEIN